MGDGKRLHQIRCQQCRKEWWQKVVTGDLPGGIRIRCKQCGEVAVHTSCSLHPDEPVITRDGDGDWSGEVGGVEYL